MPFNELLAAGKANHAIAIRQARTKTVQFRAQVEELVKLNQLQR